LNIAVKRRYHAERTIADNSWCWQSWGEGNDQNQIDINGFMETMDQMCQTMRRAEDNMANQFTLQTDDELDPQLEAMTSPAHYLTASQSLF